VAPNFGLIIQKQRKFHRITVTLTVIRRNFDSRFASVPQNRKIKLLCKSNPKSMVWKLPMGGTALPIEMRKKGGLALIIMEHKMKALYLKKLMLTKIDGIPSYEPEYLYNDRL
jgi:hypothetical protein